MVGFLGAVRDQRLKFGETGTAVGPAFGLFAQSFGGVCTGSDSRQNLCFTHLIAAADHGTAGLVASFTRG